MDFAMRPAVEADLDEIYAIEHASFGSTAWPKQMMQTELSPNPNRNYFVALEGDRIVGYAGIGVVDGNHADVMTIAVTSEQRGKGLGRALMNRLIAVAAKRGAREMFLEVRADNPVAQGLYESIGFAQIDLRRAYYQPEGIDAVIMRADLSAKVVELAQQAIREPLVLGLESSCDETGVGIVRGNTLLANVIASFDGCSRKVRGSGARDRGSSSPRVFAANVASGPTNRGREPEWKSTPSPLPTDQVWQAL